MSKFLFVLDISFDKGGPSAHLLQDIMRCALNKCHDVYVVLKKTDSHNPVVPEEFSSNSRFQYRYIEEKRASKQGFLKRYLYSIHYARLCKKRYKNWACFDAVFLQSCTNAAFYLNGLKKLHCPIVFNVQDIFPYNLHLSGQLPFDRITFPIFGFLQRKAYKSVDRIITISEDMKKTLIDDGVDAKKIRVISNWSYADDLITTSGIQNRAYFDLGSNPSSFNIVYAGNIGRMQNVEIVVKAATMTKNDPRLHFYVIGGGANKEAVEKLALGLTNITFLPMQESHFAESIYSQADLNVIPLVNGGIKTALPSKTATCLRVDNQIAFCIEANSLFAEAIEKYENVHICSPIDASELCELILRLAARKADSVKSQTNETALAFVKEKMSSVKNPAAYIETMEVV